MEGWFPGLHTKPVVSLCTNQEFVIETRQVVILTAVADTTLRSGAPMCASWPVDTGSATGELESHRGCSSHSSVFPAPQGLWSFPVLPLVSRQLESSPGPPVTKRCDLGSFFLSELDFLIYV